MAEIELKVQVRVGQSKKALSEMRKGRQIPGVVYGGGRGNLNVAVAEKELLGALKKGGANAILRLRHDKGEDTVIVKALQKHAVTNSPIHADFQRISMKEKIEVRVPLHVSGEAPGVKLQGGVLEHILRELKVRCLPNAIPQRIDVDVSRLDVGHNILVSQLPIPEGIEVLDDPQHIVVNIVHPTIEEAPAPAAEGGPAEPEVIAKGKKEEGTEEEGKAEAGKAPAKAEAPKKEEAKK